MIISIHGISLRNVASTPQEAVDITAKAGFKYIEIPVTTWRPLTNPETATKKEISEIKDVLNSRGIEARSLGMIWPSDYVMVTSSPAYWERNINYAKKLFEFSNALGINVMNLGGPQVRSIPANINYYEGLKILVKFWKEACKHAEDMSVIVGIEHIVRSHSNNVADTTKQVIDLVSAINSSSFQINFQVHQASYADLDVTDAIRASGDMTKLVHIADVAGFNQIVDPISFMTPGKGKLDFVSVFKAFKDIGYDGEFCMEPSPGTLGKDFISELKMGRELLESKWIQA